MSRILIVDDEEKIRVLIGKYAKFEGYEVVEAKSGIEAITLCEREHFDIIVMDVMMPELDGFSACKEIRKFSDTPMIMLSARGEEYDRIHGFEVGVDDYIVKPFSPKELMMRITAILKRYGKKYEEREKDVFVSDGVVVDYGAHLVTVDGSKVDLSPKEYDLLVYLIRNKNLAVTREQLITKIWGYDFYGDDRTLDTHIKLLRKALGNYSNKIVTIRGVGYRFEADQGK
ncbi:MAG: response regulator transcription factor [Erysipelotrichales bacterium]|nr:response regulator transcription factor [Erysipelotrichales bacterium]